METRRLWITMVAAMDLTGAGITGDRVWAVNAWERWQQPLTSSQSRTPLQAYHDVQIEATFWVKNGTTCTEPPDAACTNPKTTGTCFKGLAFWDGDATHPEAFMVRSAFPKGTWCWKTCLLPKTRPDPNQPSICSPDTGLNQSGEVAVGAPSASVLYSNGFLKAPDGGRSLTYWNGQTPFQWIGDTAWNAPINHASNPTFWKTYVTKRANSYVGNSFDGGNGFTNVLVAPAVQTQVSPPAGGFRGFVTPSGCNSGNPPVVPASCHYWDSVYWRDFDTLVKDANDAGIVVVVADVMDPLNRAGSNQKLTPQVPFPARVDASAFARNFAARLAGSFVIFSPSFDSKASDSTIETTTANHLTAADLISAVGASIHSAAPRNLIGVHLAGGSNLTDYDQFQSTAMPWLSFQMFQSGHHAGTCLPGVANDYANFACRARAFSLRFRCTGETVDPTCTGLGAPASEPVKPAVNVEGQYEALGDSETRVQTRHTAWNSGLSGSFGFNIGVFPDITTWSNPTAYNSPSHLSDDDLGRLKGLFKSLPWTTLIPRHDALVEQNNFPGTQTQCAGAANGPASGAQDKADWLQLWKPLIAFDSTTGYGLAYLPRPAPCTIKGQTTPYNPTTSIVISRANNLNISCSTWKGQWISPGDTSVPNGFGPTTATCIDSGGGPIKFVVPQGSLTCNGNCDRVLKLTRMTSGTGNSPKIVANTSSADLEPDVDISDDGQTSTIIGQLSRNGLRVGGPVPLSGSDLLFRKLPSAALDAGGNFLIAWEEENAAGTDDIMAARFDPRLEPLGLPFMLNDTVDGQQAEPWVSGDDSGNTVAVWTSYSEDEQIAGDIYGKVMDSSGQPLGSELLISTDNQGNQFMPQVQMDGDGGFVVAWNEEAPDDLSDQSSLTTGTVLAKASASRVMGGVYYRIFGADGRPRGDARRVDGSNPGQARLSRLEVHRHGGFTIRFHGRSASGQNDGEHSREYNRDGNPEAGDP